jgi:hypothetical protein
MLTGWGEGSEDCDRKPWGERRRTHEETSRWQGPVSLGACERLDFDSRESPWSQRLEEMGHSWDARWPQMSPQRRRWGRVGGSTCRSRVPGWWLFCTHFLSLDGVSPALSMLPSLALPCRYCHQQHNLIKQANQGQRRQMKGPSVDSSETRSVGPTAPFPWPWLLLVSWLTVNSYPTPHPRPPREFLTRHVLLHHLPICINLIVTWVQFSFSFWWSLNV